MKFSHLVNKTWFIGLVIALISVLFYKYFMHSLDGFYVPPKHTDHCKDKKNCKKCIKADKDCYWNSKNNKCHDGKEGKYSSRKCPEPATTPTASTTNAATTAAPATTEPTTAATTTTATTTSN